MSKLVALHRRLKDAQIRVDAGARRLIFLEELMVKAHFCDPYQVGSCDALQSFRELQFQLEIRRDQLKADYETQLVMLKFRPSSIWD